MKFWEREDGAVTLDQLMDEGGNVKRRRDGAASNAELWRSHTSVTDVPSVETSEDVSTGGDDIRTA